jgi:phosphomannomutase
MEKHEMEITMKTVNNKKSNKGGKVETVGATNGRLKEMQEANNGERIERQVGRRYIKKEKQARMKWLTLRCVGRIAQSV